MSTSASGTTPHYGLSQWESSDYVLREDFNADNLAIDSAIYALAGRCRIVHGKYTGAGEYGQSHKNRLNFDFKPLLIVIMPNENSNYHTQTVAIAGTDVVSNYGTTGSTAPGAIHLTWGNSYVEWYSESQSGYQLNTGGKQYFYVALG